MWRIVEYSASLERAFVMPPFPNLHIQTFLSLYPAYGACIIYQTLVFVNFVLTQNV